MKKKLMTLLALAASPLAWADSAPSVPLLPKYRQECSACHVAYPPGMLPAASWQRVMGNLQNHYGTDASLDAATIQELSGWLKAQSANTKAPSAAASVRLRR